MTTEEASQRAHLLDLASKKSFEYYSCLTSMSSLIGNYGAEIDNMKHLLLMFADVHNQTKLGDLYYKMYKMLRDFKV
jgi:hypothetical protein